MLIYDVRGSPRNNFPLRAPSVRNSCDRSYDLSGESKLSPGEIFLRPLSHPVFPAFREAYERIHPENISFRSSSTNRERPRQNSGPLVATNFYGLRVNYERFPGPNTHTHTRHFQLSNGFPATLRIGLKVSDPRDDKRSDGSNEHKILLTHCSFFPSKLARKKKMFCFVRRLCELLIVERDRWIAIIQISF